MLPTKLKSFGRRLKDRLLPTRSTPIPLDMPERLAILLTNPRSGSTWLFDALRCHPAVRVQTSASVFSYLGMSGRRYPRDLAGDSANALRVEVRLNEWELLPSFTLPLGVGTAAQTLPVYALEKCHPHFFRHDVPRFVQRLRALDSHTQVKMIYQVRDPQESLLSFLRYQQRNPSWNPHLTPSAVFPHMRRIYESLLACATLYPGLVVEYQTLEADFSAALERIFRWMWAESANTAPADAALLAAIGAATGRELRGKTAFLGARKTDVAQDCGEFQAFFARHAAEVAGCYSAYHTLLNLKAEI